MQNMKEKIVLFFLLVDEMSRSNFEIQKCEKECRRAKKKQNNKHKHK